MLYSYKRYLIYLFASLAFSIGVQVLFSYLGFPPYTGLAVALGVFILLPIWIRRSQMKKMKGGYGGDTSAGGFFGFNSEGGSGVKYVCLTCSHKFKGGSCPRCGSKMKRADF